MESTIELSVLKKEIHFVKKDSLTTGQQRNSMKISFNGKEWNGLTKYGVFKVEDTVKDVLITNSDIEIPAEVCTLDNLGKVVYFGIKGIYTETIGGTETETVYTTPYFRLGVLERGTETSGSIPEYPTQNAIDAAIENARRWAVGPSSIDKDPTDTNNAKYWSGQAEKFANILSEAGNNESERIKAEKERQNNENIRQSNEAAREVWEDYNQDKTYYKGNKISFNGNSYVCVVESTTNHPDQSNDWLLIAQKGNGLVIKDKYTTVEELRAANPNHTYTYQVEQPNGEFYIYSDIASDWISIGTIQGPKGETGEKGDKGDQGIRGEKGEKGDTGASNILTIGSVTSGSAPAVTITGDSPNQVLNFVLEKGDKGEQGEPGTRGEKGEKGDKGDKGEKGNAFTYADFTPDQLAALKGEKGDTGSRGEPGPPGKDGITPEIVEGELVTVPSAGGGSDLSLGITGATVGQIAKITAVDTGGKPTKWGPVDMPDGGSGGKQLLYRHNISQDAVLTTDSFDTSGANIDLSVYSHLYIRGMFICNSPKETYGRLYLNGTNFYQIQYFNRKIGQTVGFEADIICLKTQNKSSAALLSFAWCSEFNLKDFDNIYVGSGGKNPRVNDNLQSIGFSAAESADIFAVKAGSYVEVWGD